jgi:hypothetical protein
MSIKRTPDRSLPKNKDRQGFSEQDADPFVAENDEELIESIKRARAEFQRGVYSRRSVKEIAAAGAKRFRAQSKASRK